MPATQATMNRATETAASPRTLAAPSPVHDHELPAATSDKTAAEIALSAARVRSAVPCSSVRVAAALARTVAHWRISAFPPRSATISQLAASTGMTPPLLEESLDALLARATRASLVSLAPQLPRTNRLLGFIMAGNVAGAGIHEICAALLAGAGLLIKTASAEPFFFPSFIRTLAEVDPAVAARVAVLNFGRDEESAMRELWRCSDGGVVAYGDDASIAALTARDATGGARPLAGFGSRLSGALMVVAPGAGPSAAETAVDGLARDVTLFEQRGCLSPHHIFVAGDAGAARRFAAHLARALACLEARLPAPQRLPLGAAASIRALRERARWRALAERAGDGEVELWEGPRMAWTVIYDAAAVFSASPGYRTVFVSALKRADELGSRLDAAAGPLEAFALAAPLEVRERLAAKLRRLGVTYVCDPGRMQSPPLDWPHGGGAMLELLREAAR